MKRNFIYFFCVLTLQLSFSCSNSIREDIQANDNAKEQPKNTSLYQGVFTSKNSGQRGKFEIDFEKEDVVATFQLSNNKHFSAKSSEDITKSHHTTFTGENISFKLNTEDKSSPQVSDLKIEGQENFAMIAEGEEIRTISGYYYNTSDNATDILEKNKSHSFNLIFSKKEGMDYVSIQTIFKEKVLTLEKLSSFCNTNGYSSDCEYTNGSENSTIKFTVNNQEYTLSGAYAIDFKLIATPDCMSVAGNWNINSDLFGEVEGRFASDNPCSMKTYYVSTNGDDSNSGLSESSPWKTLEKVNTLDLEPGTQIKLKGGSKFKGNLNFTNKDGNDEENPITISSYGKGKATIVADKSYGIYAYNTSGMHIENLIVSGSGMHSNESSGIMFYADLNNNQKLGNIEITNCEVSGFRDYGIVMGSWNGNTGFKDVEITHNKVFDCLDVGIGSYGYFSKNKVGYSHENLNVRYCEVYNIPGFNKPKHSGNGIVLSDVQYSIVEKSTVYDCGYQNTACGGPVGIWYWDADSVVIQCSEAYNISSGSGCDGAGFDLDGGVTNGIIQYNYSHDNDGGGLMVGQFDGARAMENITVRYNISENDAKTNGGSIYLFNGSSSSSMKNINIYNNTVYLEQNSSNTDAAAIKYNKWKPITRNINFYNNLLYVSNGADLINVPSSYDGNFKGNLYFANSTDFSIKYKGEKFNSLSAFRATNNEIHSGESVGIEANPKLVDPGKGVVVGHGEPLEQLKGYELSRQSPALQNGLKLPFNDGSSDFFGNLLDGKKPNIGAFGG